MTGKLMDDLELYSDLLASVGTNNADRPLTPIECSDYIKRLQDETGESLEKLSIRLGLGKKRKTKTMDEPPDTSQIKLFLKLQNLSRKSAYMLRFGKSTGDRVGFTIGCLVTDLTNKRDQDVILQTIMNNIDTQKITKVDVSHIIERKRKSPTVPIEEIIEHVMKIKPVVEIVNIIILRATPLFLKLLDNLVKKQGMTQKQILIDIINKKFTNNEIKSINLKGDYINIVINDNNLKSIEDNWKSNKTNVTDYFNKILLEAMKNV